MGVCCDAIFGIGYKVVDVDVKNENLNKVLKENDYGLLLPNESDLDDDDDEFEVDFTEIMYELIRLASGKRLEYSQTGSFLTGETESYLFFKGIEINENTDLKALKTEMDNFVQKFGIETEGKFGLHGGELWS